MLQACAPDFNYEISWGNLPGGMSHLLGADKATAYGWWAPHYGAIEPAAALLLEYEGCGKVELVTEFRPLG